MENIQKVGQIDGAYRRWVVQTAQQVAGRKFAQLAHNYLIHDKYLSDVVWC